MNLAEQRPDVFVKHVLLNDPRYVKVFEGMIEEAVAKRGATAAPAGAPAAAPAVTELPKPDSLLPDGSLGYSAEATQKVVEHHLAPATSACSWTGRIEQSSSGH